MEELESQPPVNKSPPSQTQDLAEEQANPVASPQADNAALAEVMKSLLAPMQKQLEDLAKENSALREEVNARAEPIPTHLQGNDFPANPNAARSVVISTRPVRDNPEMYNAKGIVDAGGLSVNDASPLSGKNR